MLTLENEISIFLGIDLKKRRNVLKRSNVMKCKKPNEKFQSYVIKSLWEVIYAHFYN